MMKINRIYHYEEKQKLLLPMFESRVKAGFPSPADNYIQARLDLNDLLVKNPSATYFVRVSGDSMELAHIYDQDILIVDRSLTPKNDEIIIASINGELTVKRLLETNGKMFLAPDNPCYKLIEIKKDMDNFCWGIVTSAIHQFH